MTQCRLRDGRSQGAGGIGSWCGWVGAGVRERPRGCCRIDHLEESGKIPFLDHGAVALLSLPGSWPNFETQEVREGREEKIEK